MSLDFVSALKAPFSGEGWVKKLIIGGILLLIPIVQFAVMGYVVKYLKNVLNGEDRTVDFSDFGGLFSTGFKAILGSILLFIPFMLLIFIVFTLFSEKVLLAQVIVQVASIVFGFVACVLMARFAMDEKILSMVDIASAMKIYAGNKTLLPFILFSIAMGIVYGIVYVICTITLVGIILIPFILLACYISMYNLVGQFVKNSPNFEEVKASVQ